MQLQCNVVWNCSSLTLALPRTVKVTLAFSVHHRDGETMVIHRLYRTVDMGFAMSLPRGGYLILPPRTRIRRGVQLRGGNKEQQ